MYAKDSQIAVKHTSQRKHYFILLPRQQLRPRLAISSTRSDARTEQHAKTHFVGWPQSPIAFPAENLDTSHIPANGLTLRGYPVYRSAQLVP